MNVIQYIKDLEVTVGHQYRGKCPVCHRPHTLGVTNDMGTLKWQCFSASCSVRGMVRDGMSALNIQSVLTGRVIMNNSNSPSESAAPIILPDSVIRTLPKQAHAWLQNWGIDGICTNYWDIKEDRVVFPIYKDHVLVDGTGRTLHHHIIPKWKRYGGSGEPFVVGCKHGSGSVAVVVEDAVSACVCASEGYVGVALLGTSLGAGHSVALSVYDKVIVALDPDAALKSLSHVRELRKHVPNVVALNLEDDIKYRVGSDLNKLRELSEV